MPLGLSLYLDVVRFLSAIVVVVFHASSPLLSGGWFKLPFGLEAVMAFFVLSGFVIAHVVSTREHSPADYASARLARLWSVLLPALALTPIFDLIGRQFDPGVYDAWSSWLGFDHPAKRLALAAIFANELWFHSVAPLSDGPVWSLGFEAWYYVLFGAWTFLQGRRRYITLTIVTLIIGPKILLLMPSWILGVWLYNKSSTISLPRSAAITLFSVAPLLIVVAHLFHITGWFYTFHRLKYASTFVWLNIAGLLLVSHFYAAIALAPELELVLKHMEKPIRVAAGYTFEIYLLHHPIMMMMDAILNVQPNGAIKTSIIVVSALVLSVAIGLIIKPWHGRLRLAVRRVLN